MADDDTGLSLFGKEKEGLRGQGHKKKASSFDVP